MPESGDPRDVRAIAVTAEDVLAALEANQRGPGEAVLRITPPFSGRMRARLHVTAVGDEREEYDQEPRPVHVDPARLVADPPAYPRPDDTEDELRADPETEYTPERHRQRHQAAVERWREAVRESFVDEVALDLPGGTHRVSVSVLG